MEVKITKLPKSAVKLGIKEEATNLKKYFDEAYKKLAQTIDIKGFRAGKAPKIMTIEAIGRARYLSYTLDLALPEVYTNAVKQEKIVPVSSPKVDIKVFDEDKDMEFDATVDVLPEVKIGDYKKIKIKHKPESTEVKDEDVEKVIKKLQFEGAQYIVTPEGAKVGDRMEISFEGKVKGVATEKYTSKHYPFILGEKVLLPEFEKKIEGTKKSDKLNFSLKITGDDVDFEVTIDEVWKVNLAPLDEEFAKKFGSKDVKELWQRISDSIKKEKEMKEKQIVEEKVFNEMLKKVTIELPESMIDHEIDHRVEHLRGQMGPGFEKYLESVKKTMESLRKDIRPAAERAVKISLSLSEIAKDMGNFDPKKLTKDIKENQNYQQKALEKTVSDLVTVATK